MTPIRFQVLKYYLSSRTNVRFSELLNFFFAPSYKSIAQKIIRKRERDGSYDKVYLAGIEDPLYYPLGLKEHSLHQVIVESFNKQNWHYYEIPQTRVTSEDVVVDCGAAEGLFALMIYKRCRKVYLVEPLQNFVQALKKTFLHAGNVTILPVAISDREFSTKMISNDIASALSDEGEGEPVQVTTLDKLFYEKDIQVTYLKMDLEGYDYVALKGAEKLIRKNRPKIAVTTYHAKEHAEQMEAYLKSLVPEYNILCKGISQETGSPIMLHAWCH